MKNHRTQVVLVDDQLLATKIAHLLIEHRMEACITPMYSVSVPSDQYASAQATICGQEFKRKQARTA